jgi:hypothetical protein
MAKIAGIKGQSPEAYSKPPGKRGVRTVGNSNTGVLVVLGNTSPGDSLLFDGIPISIEAAAGDRAIIMFTGSLQDPNATEVTASCNVNVGIYLDGSSTPVYSINPFLQFIDFPSDCILPISLYFETDELSAGSHTIDVRAFVSIPDAGVGAKSQNNFTTVIVTPV